MNPDEYGVGAAGASLPDRLAGAIAMRMIGHLDPDGRRALWARLAGCLAPGAPLVVGLQPPDQAVSVPRTVSRRPRSVT